LFDALAGWELFVYSNKVFWRSLWVAAIFDKLFDAVESVRILDLVNMCLCVLSARGVFGCDVRLAGFSTLLAKWEFWGFSKRKFYRSVSLRPENKKLLIAGHKIFTLLKC
jgi:hypothetical protein